MKERLLLAAGASALSATVFVLAMHIHFPSDAIVDRVRWEVQNGSDGQYALEASEASWWFPGGVTLTDAMLLSVDNQRRRRTDDEGATGSPLLRADSASVRLALLPLLSGTRVVQYALELFGGELHGQLGESATHRLITVKTDGLDLAKLPLNGDEWSVDATGKLRIDADLALATEKGKKAAESDGSILIEIDDFVIQNSSVMGMDLVAAEFSEAVLELQMKGKKAEVERGRFASELIDLTLDGYVNMSASDPDRWRLRVELSFTLGESLDTMASMLPSLKRGRGEDGTYHMMCTGTWGKPVCREDRSKVRGKRPSPQPEFSSKDGPDGEFEPKKPRRERRTKDADQRREDRRRRLEERRARLREDRPPMGEDNFDNGPDIVLDRDFDQPRGRPLPFDREDEDLPPLPPEFEDDFPQQDLEFDDQLEPLEELPEFGYIDE